MVLLLASFGTALGYSCTPPPPKPIDVDSFPTASTSATPLYITNDPAASASASNAVLVVPGASVSGELPPDVPIQIEERTATCPRATCWRTGLTPKPGETKQSPLTASPDLGITPPVALWQEHLAAKGHIDFPRAKGFGLLGVVLRGVVAVVPSEGGSLAALQSWGSFVAPGAGVALVADQAGADVLVVAYADDGPLGDKLHDLRMHERAYYWAKRSSPVRIEDLRRHPEITWADGAARVRMAFRRDESPRAYLGTMVLGPQQRVPTHAHQDSWEILLPIRIGGSFELSGVGLAPDKGPFPKTVEAHPGSLVMIPATVEHAWKPDGSTPLLAIQMFVPPGPEERYTKLAGAPAPPAPSALP